MATPKPKERPSPQFVRHAHLDFNDQALDLREYSDGVWAMEIDGYKLLLTLDEMQQIVGAFVRLGHEKGWT